MAITETFVVTTYEELAGLTVQEGDIGIVTSTAKTYIYDGTTWTQLLFPTGGEGSVISVNGQTGAVTITAENLRVHYPQQILELLIGIQLMAGVIIVHRVI